MKRFFLIVLAFIGFACGSENDSQTKIVSGLEIKDNSTPVVALQRLSNKHWYTYCSGTLISSQHILTAAHCSQKNGLSHLASEVRVRIGHHMVDSKEGLTINVREIHSHPDFNEDIMSYRNGDGIVIPHQAADIAVWTLTERVKIRPASLSSEFHHQESFQDGKHFEVWGYGKKSQWDVRQKGHSLAMAVIPFQTLTHMYIRKRVVHRGNYVTKRILVEFDSQSDTEFYLGNQESADTCGGDSGGPVFSPGFNLLGITSRGPASCVGGGVYTKVVPYEGWIRKTIMLTKAI